MENIFASSVAVPIFQVGLLLLLSTAALLFGRLKLALLINYCFTMHWGYILNLDSFKDNGVFFLNKFTYAYVGFGLLIICLALLGFMVNRD